MRKDLVNALVRCKADNERLTKELALVIDGLPRCGAEDMGGWPACSEIGTHGPSESYLEREMKRAGYVERFPTTYCDAHAKMNFRGREGDDNAELPYAAVVRAARGKRSG